MQKIAVIGAGAIGRAWAVVFARAGHPVALFSRTETTLARANGLISASLEALTEFALLGESPRLVKARIAPTTVLADAVEGAIYVQENAPENLAEKKALFHRLDELAAAEATIASSTSTIPASAFASEVKGRHRCLVAHPVNPPHVVPAVEISPAPFTAADVVARTRELLASVGQTPIVLNKEITGFVMNRLQSLLACEAIRLVEEGYITTEDLDRAVKEGLGLRWSFMGPLETLDLNAAGGFAEFARTFAPIMHAIDASPEAQPRPWSEAVIRRIDEDCRRLKGSQDQAKRILWRDRRLMALMAHKRKVDKAAP